MGIIEFFIICIVLVVLGYLTTFAMDSLAPNHPSIVNKIIWFVIIIIILMILFNAMGLNRFDIQIPRVR